MIKVAIGRSIPSAYSNLTHISDRDQLNTALTRSPPTAEIIDMGIDLWCAQGQALFNTQNNEEFHAVAATYFKCSLTPSHEQCISTLAAAIPRVRETTPYLISSDILGKDHPWYRNDLHACYELFFSLIKPILRPGCGTLIGGGFFVGLPNTINVAAHSDITRVVELLVQIIPAALRALLPLLNVILDKISGMVSHQDFCHVLSIFLKKQDVTQQLLQIQQEASAAPQFNDPETVGLSDEDVSALLYSLSLLLPWLNEIKPLLIVLAQKN